MRWASRNNSIVRAKKGVKFTHSSFLPGSARVPRAGEDVPSSRTFLRLKIQVKFVSADAESPSRTGVSTRDACATRNDSCNVLFFIYVSSEWGDLHKNILQRCAARG
jgi:hypothetical protein